MRKEVSVLTAHVVSICPLCDCVHIRYDVMQ